MLIFWFISLCLSLIIMSLDVDHVLCGMHQVGATISNMLYCLNITPDGDTVTLVDPPEWDIISLWDITIDICEMFMIVSEHPVSLSLRQVMWSHVHVSVD